jgi:septal ring-binding cell division protein DamX
MRIPTKGSLAQTSLVAILSEFAENRMTGMVRAESGAAIKVVYFQQGTIAYSSSNDRSDRLTEVLKRAGKLTAEQIDHAQARIKPGVSLGKTLVELGYLTSKELLWGARTQVESIIHQLLFWNEGTYQILEGPLPKEIASLNINVSQIIFSGIIKSQDRRWVLERIGSPETMYSLSEEFHLKNANYRLPIETVASRMNGKRTLNDIAHSAGLDAFEVCKTVAAMEILGMATRAKEKPRQIPLPVEPATTPETEKLSQEVPLVSADLSLGEVLQIPTVEQLQKEVDVKPEELNLLSGQNATEPSEVVKSVEEPLDREKEPEESELETNHVIFVPLDMRDRRPGSIFGISPHRSIILIIAALVLGIGIFVFLWYLLGRSPEPEEPIQPIKPRTVVQAPTPPVKETVTVSPKDLAESGKLPEAAQMWQSSLSADKDKFTLQIVLACQEKTVLDTMQGMADFSELRIIPAEYNGMNCYRVILGVYPTEADAMTARSSLPPAVRNRKSQAQVVPISRIVP